MKSKWYTVFILSKVTAHWEKIAEIKSEGLANLLLPKLHEIYGEKAVRFCEGKHTTPPPSFYL